MATEKRLIDADALIYDIQNNLWDYETVDGISATLVLKQTVKDIRNCPTVDAVPVVRCKDCKHYVWDEFDGAHVCLSICKFIKPDFWCADGERRTDG